MIQIQLICARLSRQETVNIVLKSVVLQASACNNAALSFYESCGYQRQSLHAGYYGRVIYIFVFLMGLIDRAKTLFLCDCRW